MPGFIFEFKHTKDEHTDLSALADSALQQIEAKKYDTELRLSLIHIFAANVVILMYFSSQVLFHRSKQMVNELLGSPS